MSLTLVQWENSTVTPKLDAIMYDDGSYGIVKGCAITHQGTNLLKIASGFIKIAGRLIEVSEETITCEVSASGTVNGQLWVRLNLGAVTPVSFMSEAAAVLTPLTQNEDCNFDNGIYELQLATYNIDESVITNLVEAAPELERLRTALDNIDLAANKVTYDNTHSGLTATKVQGAIDEINDNLTAKVTKFSGKASGNTYVTVDGLAYDATNKKLGLKVNGADTVIPFSGGIESAYDKPVQAQMRGLTDYTYTVTSSDVETYKALVAIVVGGLNGSGASATLRGVDRTYSISFNSDKFSLRTTYGIKTNLVAGQTIIGRVGWTGEFTIMGLK